MRFIPDGENTTASALRFIPDQETTSPDYSPVGLGVQVGKAIAPAIGEGWKTLGERMPAMLRERARTMSQTGVFGGKNAAADAAYQSPSLSENFQNEDIRKTNEFLDKTDLPVLDQVKNLPEDQQTAARFAAGVVPSAIGMAQDFATNPRDIGLALAGGAACKALGKVQYKGLSLADRAENLPIGKFLASQEGQTAKAGDLTAQAYDKTIGLLKPPKKELNTNPFEHPAVEESAKVITKAKDYGELKTQLDNAASDAMDQRAAKYTAGTPNPATSHLDEAADFLQKSYADTRIDPDTMKLAQATYDRELTTAKQAGPNALGDPDYLQQQKQFYQDRAQALYKKAKQGTLTDHENNDLQMNAKIASGYQTKLETVDPRIAGLNRKFAGTSQGAQLSTDMMNTAKLHPEARTIDDLVDILEAGKTTKLGAVRGILSKVPGLKGLAGRTVEGETSAIAGLRGKAESAQNIADLIQLLKERALPGAVPPPLGLPPPVQTPGVNNPPMTTNLLPGSARKSILAKALPPAGQSGPTINALGGFDIALGDLPDYPRTGNLPAVQTPGAYLQPTRPTQIELPETPKTVMDAKITELKKAMGVPEYGAGPRSVTPEEAIPKDVGAAPEQDGLIMEKRRRAIIEKMLALRKRNFPNS